MSTLGDSVPLVSTDASTDADWKQWALSVFGGNEARATAAAQAAAAARRAGATNDALFAAARAAYDTAGSPTADVSLPPAGLGGATTDCVVRPSGRGILGVGLVVILVAGIGSVIVRSGTSSVVPVVGAAAVIMGVWFALSLRSSVRVLGAHRVRSRSPASARVPSTCRSSNHRTAEGATVRPSQWSFARSVPGILRRR